MWFTSSRWPHPAFRFASLFSAAVIGGRASWTWIAICFRPVLGSRRIGAQEGAYLEGCNGWLAFLLKFGVGWLRLGYVSL